MLISADQVANNNGMWGKKFLCGICGNFALDVMIHDGGNRRRFCTGVFCSTCCYPYSDNPKNHYFNGSARKKEVKCPGGCSFDFKDPYFRYLSSIEREIYERININCKDCGVNFFLRQYQEHLKNCGKGKVAINNGNRSIIEFVKKDFDQQVVKRKDYHLIGNNIINYFKNFKYRDCINQVELNLRSIVDLPRVTINQDMSVADFKKYLKFKVNINKTDIDLIWMEYRCLNQFEKLSDFLDGIPIDSVINLVVNKPEIAVEEKLIKVKLLGSFSSK